MSYKEIKEYSEPVIPKARKRLRKFIARVAEQDTINALLVALSEYRQDETLTAKEQGFFTPEEWQEITPHN